MTSELTNISNMDTSKESAQYSADTLGEAGRMPEESQELTSCRNGGEKTQVPTWKKIVTRGSYALLAAGGVYTAANIPFHELKHDVEQAAPVMIPAGIVSEGLFIGGIAIATAGLGRRVGNPFKLSSDDVLADLTRKEKANKLIKTGVNINTIGSLGTAAVIAGGAVAYFPAEVWPGAVGIAAADAVSTVAIRTPIYAALRSKGHETREKAKVTVRQAQLEDIDQLADLDLELFDGAYGEQPPTKEDVVATFTKRFHNANGWMYVAEMNGQVEGFVTAFRTSKAVEDFVSWEDTTADGTLDGKVDPEGKYVYVANMTIAHDAVEQGAKEMLLANLFANAIHDGGIEYGYFVGRLPQFRDWLEKTGLYTEDEEELEGLAREYMVLRNDEGKPYDWQLRMYTDDGFKPSKPVANGFQDAASMNYAVPFVQPAPARSKPFDVIPGARPAFASVLRGVAKHPKILRKVI